MPKTSEKKKSEKALAISRSATDRKATFVAARARGVSEIQANKIAGYNQHSNHKGLQDAIDQARITLQGRKGYRFDDSAKLYHDLAKDKAQETADRLRARTRLDTLLGYDAPQRSEVQDNRSILIGIGLLKEMKLTPGQALKAISADTTDSA